MTVQDIICEVTEDLNVGLREQYRVAMGVSLYAAVEGHTMAAPEDVLERAMDDAKTPPQERAYYRREFRQAHEKHVWALIEEAS